MEFGLPVTYGLVSREISLKLSEANENHSEQNKKNLIEGGVAHRFKPGVRTGARPYISTVTLKKNIATINKVNRTRKLESCPVCNIKFISLPSHLWNSHRLIKG